MARQEKMLLCFKWLLRLLRMGANDDEILKALECVMKHGDGLEVLEIELEIKEAIRYRQSVAYLDDIAKERKRQLEKLKELEKLMASLAKPEDFNV